METRPQYRAADPSVSLVLAGAGELLDSAYYSFLTTLDEEGMPASRLVQHFSPDNDLTLWIGTSASSRKVAHIRRNPAVLITCQSPKERAYVALRGRAGIHTEPEILHRYWREPWRVIWPGGPDSEDYLVLEVRCERVEIVDLSDARMGAGGTGMHPQVAVRAEDGWLALPDDT